MSFEVFVICNEESLEDEYEYLVEARNYKCRYDEFLKQTFEEMTERYLS